MGNGKFITFEGPEGAGKTTVINMLANKLQEMQYKVLVTREPGGIRISEKIREVILDPVNTEMDARTEALLYAAARRQHLVERVIPALKEGYIILCDRFLDSSLAYQGYARGLGMDEVLTINTFAINGLMPDLTLYFDIDPIIGLARIERNSGREINRLDLEREEFHLKVRAGYLCLLEKYPERIRKINADQEKQNVLKDVQRIISEII